MNLFDYNYSYKLLPDGKYLIEINNKHYTVDAELFNVVNILNSVDSFENATFKYNQLKNEQNTVAEFEEYARALVDKLNINEKEDSFLLWEYGVLSPNKARNIARHFKFLFNPNIFYPLFLILFLIAFYIIFGVDLPKDTNPQSFILIIILYAISTFFHELGHIASCYRFTNKNGEIGVGIYIFYPIFYSNISAIWMANKNERIITNLAGIFMQLMIGAFLLLIYEISGIQFCIELAKVLVVFGLFQLLPFIRSDGYWVVSDLLNEPNLLKKSNEALWDLIKNLFAFSNKVKINDNNKWLALYSVFNYSVVFYFIYYQLKYNREKIFDFPFYTLYQVKQVLFLNFENIRIDWTYLPVFVFYFILFQYCKKGFNLLYPKTSE